MSVRALFSVRVVLIAAGLSVICPQGSSFGEDAVSEPRRLTHGPMLGRPGSDSLPVWVRTSTAGAFSVVVESDAGDVARFTGETDAARDNTGVILLQPLHPGTRYRYRIGLPDVAPGKEVAEGTFRTLPSQPLVRGKHNPRGLFNFTFEHGSCNFQFDRGGEVGHDLPAYRTMFDQHRDEVDFQIFSGDFIYEARRSTSRDVWRREAGVAEDAVPAVLDVMPRIVGVWENYKLYHDRAPSLRQWHQHTPSVFMFDDHELLNDINGTADLGPADARTLFRDVGVRAWQDHVGWANPPSPGSPAQVLFGRAAFERGDDVLTDGAADFSQIDPHTCPTLHIHPAGGNAAGVYEILEVLDQHRLRLRPSFAASGDGAAYSIGARSEFDFRVSNCHFFVLNTRGMRNRHDFDQPDKPGISMLGEVQRQWLTDGVRRTDADFVFVVSTVSFGIPHVSPQQPEKDESWTAYLAERDALLEVLEGVNKPVLLLSGDLHNSIATRFAESVYEFVCGPHNSPNHSAVDEGNRPPNGPFTWRGRTVDILWSSYWLPETPRRVMQQPYYTLVEVQNVLENPGVEGEDRWVALPRPFVTFRVHDGLTGNQVFAYTVHASIPPAR